MSVKVSVIIAVYNVEKYIRQTLESVVNQTFKDIEIIIVDNKSTDKTLDIINEFARKDERIIVFKNSSNLKQGIARNFGIKMARGEYICFLDGDDYFDLTAIEKLYKRISETDADITLCTWKRFDDKTGKILKDDKYSQLKNISESLYDKTFNWIDFRYDVFEQTSVPWDKIYKREFLIKKDVKFPGGIFFEDNVFVYDALFKAEKISVVREDLIYYRCNRKNAVTNSRNEIFFDYFKIFSLIGENLKKIGLFKEVRCQYWHYEVNTLFWWFKKVKLPYKRRFFNMMKSYFKSINMDEQDLQWMQNRTLFVLERFTTFPFFLYYPLVHCFDKIFRIEKGYNKSTIVYFSFFEVDCKK